MRANPGTRWHPFPRSEFGGYPTSCKVFIMRHLSQVLLPNEDQRMVLSDRGCSTKTVDSLDSQLNLLAVPRGLAKRHRLVLRLLILLSFIGLVERNASAEAVAQNAPASAIGQGLPFAVADFDGDFRFDLASIESWPNNSGTTDYWIQLQLSAVGRQSIRFVGAPGGLRLEARDVNKDRAVDLVLVNAWSREPVAILLNDGRGGFSRVEPNAFPEAFTNLATTWSSTPDGALDAFGVPLQSRAGACWNPRVLPQFHQRADAILAGSAELFLGCLLNSHAGRAPPSAAQYL